MFNKLTDYNAVTIIADKTGVEGGYVNNPNDLGRETNHGITIALATDYKAKLVSQFGWNGKMIDLSLDAAKWLYRTHFWDRMSGDALLAIHPLIADKTFDVCINSGVSKGVSNLQTVLNLNNNRQKLYPDIPVDGGCGARTIDALKAYVAVRGKEGIERLLVALLVSQGDIYNEITIKREQNEEFYYGWLGRVTRDTKLYAKLLWG